MRGVDMEKLKRLPWELVFDLLMTILGIIVILISLGYGFGTFRRPGPGLYPFFLGLSVAFFGAVLLLSEFRKLARSPLFGKGEIHTFLLMIAAFCLWILLMPLLGYVVVSLVVTFGVGKIMKLEGWWKPLSIAAGTTLFIYLLFDYWLYIDLPRGILG
jgi:putative tricarboxylic transport membrane protein